MLHPTDLRTHHNPTVREAGASVIPFNRCERGGLEEPVPCSCARGCIWTFDCEQSVQGCEEEPVRPEVNESMEAGPFLSVQTEGNRMDTGLSES